MERKDDERGIGKKERKKENRKKKRGIPVRTQGVKKDDQK